MRMRVLVAAGLAVILATLSFPRRADADAVFRFECWSRGANPTFLLDPQVISLPGELDHLQFLIGLCLELQGHPQIQGDFFH